MKKEVKLKSLLDSKSNWWEESVKVEEISQMKFDLRKLAREACKNVELAESSELSLKMHLDKVGKGGGGYKDSLTMTLSKLCEATEKEARDLVERDLTGAESKFEEIKRDFNLRLSEVNDFIETLNNIGLSSGENIAYYGAIAHILDYLS